MGYEKLPFLSQVSFTVSCLVCDITVPVYNLAVAEAIAVEPDVLAALLLIFQELL